MIVIDIWGGDRHQEHLARFIVPEDPAQSLPLIRAELDAGNLVNLRRDLVWGPSEAFDHRQTGVAA